MRSLAPSPVRKDASSLVAIAITVALGAAGGARAGDLCFDVVPYEVQASPSCLVEGDLNGDGSPDIVVANHAFLEDTISVLINNGDGTFAAAVNHPVAGRPYWLALGDLDGDDDLDVVVSCFFGHTVAVLLNDGAGGLGAPADIFVGFFPTMLTLAQLDGDDHMDIAVAISANATVAILSSNGDGTFGKPVPYPVSMTPYGVTTLDLNNDGALDLAVANYDADAPAVSLLLNNGDGTFADQVLLAVDAAPVGVSRGDLDGDGFPDLVVTNYGATAEADTLSVFMNDGAGGFLPAVPYTVGVGPYWVDIGDLNDDSHPDLVSANTGLSADGTLSVLFNNGDGTFAPAQNYIAGGSPGCVVIGDLDGNSSPELATCSYGDFFLFVLFNRYPSIVSDPTGLSAADGDPAQFTVTVSGPPPFTLQWRRNGLDLEDGGTISGATTDTLVIAAVSPGDAGLYTVVVSNDCGDVTSASAELIVIAACSSSADFDGSGTVDGADLGTLLGYWGTCPPPAAPGDCCPGDLNNDGRIDGSDLGSLLGQWG